MRPRTEEPVGITTPLRSAAVAALTRDTIIAIRPLVSDQLSATLVSHVFGSKTTNPTH